MGQKDAKARVYLSDNERFADVFNFYLFDGQQVIKPEDLVERDTATVVHLYGLDKREIAKQRWRDLLKSAIIKSNDSCVFILLGVENQSDIHYAMPVKNMIYDALEYGSQVNEAAAKHRKNHDYDNPGEFLSGFKKDDRLTPVITLTVYWGPDKWDAPRSLHDMFGEEYSRILRFVDDYRLHLIVPDEIEDFGLFHTSLGDVLEFIKASNSEQSVSDLLGSRESFKHLKYEDVTAIETFSGIQLGNNSNRKGEVDMCKAWNDRLQHGIIIGEQSGLEKGLERGLERGLEKGAELRLITQVCKKIVKGKNTDDIADDLEEDKSMISRIVDAAKRFAPEYNAEDIYAFLHP